MSASHVGGAQDIGCLLGCSELNGGKRKSMLQNAAEVAIFVGLGKLVGTAAGDEAGGAKRQIMSWLGGDEESSSAARMGTKTQSFTSNMDLELHFGKHGAEVGAKSATEYEAMADDFMNGDRGIRLEKVRSTDGTIIRFDKDTGELGMSKDGKVTTYMKTDYDYYSGLPGTDR